MATDPRREAPAYLQMWARVQLGLEAAPEPAVVRARFFRLLPEVDFVPPETWRHAAQVLAGRQLSHWSVQEAAQAEEGRLHAVVEGFASRFWEHSPTERIARWEQLIQRAADFPLILARLRSFEMGLDKESFQVSGPDSRTLELGHAIQELFALRPVERAMRREAILSRFRTLGTFVQWQETVLAVETRNPGLTRLEPILVAEVNCLCSDPLSTETQEAATDSTDLTPMVPDTASQKTSPKRPRWWVIAAFIALAYLSTAIATIDRDFCTAVSIVLVSMLGLYWAWFKPKDNHGDR